MKGLLLKLWKKNIIKLVLVGRSIMGCLDLLKFSKYVNYNENYFIFYFYKCMSFKVNK